jgi:myotubularin-related protein 14
MEISKNCRVHQRFPVPVILFGKKNICRSASLSEAAEIFYRSKTQNIDRNSSRTQHRKIDVKWLKILKVKHIVDLMVKDKFQVLGIALYQSEKSNEQHRTTFKVTGLPFPGVESFEDFIERVDKLNGKPMTTQFWERIPAQITLSMPYQLPRPNEWSAYRSWNIVQLTQNYIRYIMHLLHDPDEEAGLSLHCISGWDRTPLYISLLRILLWAEGLVHQSLDVDQMLYLTVAYDWLLFGHNLVNRLNKGRQIFYFCFWVLEHLKDDDYSYGYELQLKNMNWEAGTYTGVAPYEVPSTPAIDGGNTNSNNNQQEESNSTSPRSARAVLGELNSPERRRERKRRLEAIRAKFMRLYNVHIHPRFKDRKNIVKILLNMLPQ